MITKQTKTKMNIAKIKAEYEAATEHIITETINGTDLLTKPEVWVSGLEKWRTWGQIESELEEGKHR